MQQPDGEIPGRGALAACTERVLRPGSSLKADILLIRVGTLKRAVVKDYSLRGPLVRRWWGPWMLRREERAYRALEGCVFAPQFYRRVDAQALAIEYRPGEPLSRSMRGRLPRSFLAEFTAAVEEMHARGVVHLDLSHRSNVLADSQGHPVVLDFASALAPGRSSGLPSWLRRVLEAVDRRAVRKWQRKLGESE